MSTPLQITFKGLQPRLTVETKVRAWVARLDHVCADIDRCEVAIELPHRHHAQGKRFHVRVDLVVRGHEIVVSHDPGVDEGHADVHVAIRDSFRAMRRQLEAHVHGQRRHASS